MPLRRFNLFTWLAVFGAITSQTWASDADNLIAPEPMGNNEVALTPANEPVVKNNPALATQRADEATDNQVLRLRIADPYIDVHTGPSRGYPIHQVVERGQLIEISERRTDWFFVRTPRGYQGWVHRDQLIRTLTPDGEPVDVSQMNQEDFTQYSWEFGAMGGDFDGAPVISIYGAWQYSDHLSAELSLGQSLGRFAEANFATLHLVTHPFPHRRFSPYFQIGGGVVQIDPKAAIIQPEDRQENLVHVGAGVRTYLASRLVFRVEYNNYVVLTNRNENEKVEEWKAGFSVFF